MGYYAPDQPLVGDQLPNEIFFANSDRTAMLVSEDGTTVKSCSWDL